MSDIVEWLRDIAQRNAWLAKCSEAADEIERLRDECAALRDEVELKSAALTGKSRSMGEKIKRLRGARRELVVALHTIASHFEDALYAFRDDDEAREKAEDDIAWAMEIASRHNHKGNRQ